MRHLFLNIFLAFLFKLSGLSAQSPSSAYQNLQTKLASGWNTWSYGSMTSHVLLPEGLALNVNFRQAFIGTPYDLDFFLNNLTVDKSESVKPIAHAFDDADTELMIQNWKGNDIRIQSTSSGSDLVILITPVKNHLRIIL